MGRVIVFGSINLDTVLAVPHIVSPGETVAGEGIETHPGGKGGNQALAAHNAGAGVRLIAKVGRDAAAGTMLAFYRVHGLATDGVGRSDRPTGAAFIQVEQAGGENAIVVVAGANGDFSPGEMDAVTLERGDVVVAQYEVPIPAVTALFRRAKNIGAATILNPSPAQPCPPELFRLVDHLLINESELTMLSGHPVSDASGDDVIATAITALEIASEQAIVVTRGTQGARLFVGGELLTIPGRKVEAIDTTGAGDCFTGVYAAAIARGDDAKFAAIYANAAAAISTTRPGAASSMPGPDEIAALVRDEP